MLALTRSSKQQLPGSPSLFRAAKGATFEVSLQTLKNRQSDRPTITTKGSHKVGFVYNRPGVGKEEAWDAGPLTEFR